MSEDRQNQDSGNGTTRRIPINLGLYHPIGTPQVTPVHALAPGAQSLPSLMIQPPRQDSLFPAETGQQYLSQGPVGSPTIPVSQSIDPALMNIPGTGAHAAYQANLERAANVALSFGPGQFRAYHGTGAAPFEQFLDEFMGTGEGAQAYSWGHYVAGSPGVARSYVPPGTEAQVMIGGQPMLHASGRGTALAYGALTDTAGSGPDWINDALSTLQSRRDAIPGLKMPSDQAASATERFNDAIDWINMNRRHISHTEPSQGGLLNVWVKPDHEEFLDWDLPLSKQEPEVQQKLQSYLTTDRRPWSYTISDHTTGKDIYNKLVSDYTPDNTYEESRMLASKDLNSAGIPGMRFLDQQSRNLPESGLVYKGNKILPLGMLPSTTGKDWLKYKSVEEFGNDLQSSHDGWSDYVKNDPYQQQPGMMQTGGRAKLAEAREALNFFNANKSDFQMQTTPRTYNYVVYDPKNLEITHRDGQRVHTLEPVDHDPWAEQKAAP